VRAAERVLAQQSRLVRVQTGSNRRLNAVTDAPLTGGTARDALGDADYNNPADPTFRTHRKGRYALDAVDTVNLKCVPPPAGATDTSALLWTAAAGY